MRVRALRGVCIGPERHLKPGDVADLDAGTVQFLSSIKAVERIPDEPAKAEVKDAPSLDAPKPDVPKPDTPQTKLKEK